MILAKNGNVQFEGKTHDIMVELYNIIDTFISDFGLDNLEAVLKGEITADDENDAVVNSKIIVFEDYVRKKIASAADNNLAF